VSNARILFIVKFREKYDGSCGYDGTPHSFGGLYYSALLVAQMLNSIGIWAKVVQVCDNNGIDAAVTAWKPTVVIIEALWVVPTKFVVLQKLHPAVQWVVRCHSEIPFLAYEGIAMEWLADYVTYESVSIASNSSYGTRDFDSLISAANPKWTTKAVQSKVKYLPNWYDDTPIGLGKVKDEWLDVACFGAVRPLKNQLIQALAAVEFARLRKKSLRFHINGRVEQNGDGVQKNLFYLMLETGNELIVHPWELRSQFLETLSTMDASMQVSLSETFDITAADSAVMGIPLVTSDEVVWSSVLSQAVTTNTASILSKLELVTGPREREIAGLNLDGLRAFSAQSESTWKTFCSAV
jgi:hypothetical protein